MVDDLGEEAASSSGGLTQLAKCNLTHPERDGQQLLSKKLGLALPIQFSTLQKARGVTYPGELCMLKLKSWMEFIVRMNCIHLLCGLPHDDPPRERSILDCFWKRFRELRPLHLMFSRVDHNLLDTTRTIPMVIHGDEGRGRKRNPFLVISYSSVIGFGTEKSNRRKNHKKEYNAMGLNYTLSTHLTRHVTAALPKMAHDTDALHDILCAYKKHVRRRGLQLNGRAFFCRDHQCCW